MNQRPPGIRMTLDEINRDGDGRLIATLVSDDGATATVPLDMLPEGAAVNQVIVARFRLDQTSTERRAKRVRTLQHRLFNRETDR